MQEIFMRLVRIDYLIRIKGTGTPSQLASRLEVGERTIYEYINIMKALGAPIQYSRQRRSYYYDKRGSFTISFVDEDTRITESRN